MRHRPWPIVLLAVFQLLTPFVSLYLSASALHIGAFTLLKSLIQTHQWGELFNLCALSTVAAVSIYAFKKWSYLVFMAVFAWNAVSNIFSWRASHGLYSLATLLVADLLTLAIALYFLVPSARVFFFNRKLRWWESQPRYPLDLQVELFEKDKSTLTCQLVDLSRGGVFIRTSRDLTIATGKKFLLKFKFHTLKVETLVQAVYTRAIDNDHLGVGLQFHDLPSTTRAALADLTQALRLLGVKSSFQGYNRMQDFHNWSERLFKTGKGWLPEVKSNISEKVESKSDHAA